MFPNLLSQNILPFIFIFGISSLIMIVYILKNRNSTLVKHKDKIIEFKNKLKFFLPLFLIFFLIFLFVNKSTTLDKRLKVNKNTFYIWASVDFNYDNHKLMTEEATDFLNQLTNFKLKPVQRVESDFLNYYKIISSENSYDKVLDLIRNID